MKTNEAGLAGRWGGAVMTDLGKSIAETNVVAVARERNAGHLTSTLSTTRRRMTAIACGAAFTVIAGCGDSNDPSTEPGAGGSGEQVGGAGGSGGELGEEEQYIMFLEESSMLYQAELVADPVSGSETQWRDEFGAPKPQELRELASVWMLRYPLSTIPLDDDSSVIATWADPDFWLAAGEVGIQMLRTNPTQRSGGIEEREFSPTRDGFFDRIGYMTAPELGTEDEYEQLVANAQRNGAVVGSDLVPTHSGFGPDFWLAARGYKDYPGLYSMVQIPEEHWGLLPAVDDIWGREHVSIESAERLEELGFIPGVFPVADSDPEAATWSGWSALAPIVGVDGETRRSVYAHVFKPRQPLYNWLDPSYAARRLNFGDLANNILNRGVPVLRLDANTFLGLEPQDDSTMATIFLSPLAKVATTDIAMAARKVGGYTYQEFAGPLETLKAFAPEGADMSYDFFTRAEALYALIDGDALPLRLAHHFLLEAGVQSNTLVHDLQNHDEITFQMFELGSYGDFDFEGETLNGEELKEEILDTMRSTVGSTSYNYLYRPGEDGVATTFAGFIAPALGIDDPYDASAEEVELIRRGHLLVAHANAMIPGVFSFSSWDAVGALPIPLDAVPEELTAGGDVRWVNRGGVDLMGTSSRTTTAIFELPEAQTLYGPLPEQLEDPDSFMSRLQAMLAAREEYGIKDATMNAVPPVEDLAVALLVMTLPDSSLAITALNYGRTTTSATVDLTQIPPGIAGEELAGLAAIDAVTGQDAGTVSETGSLEIELEELQGRTIVVQRQ